MKMKSGQLTKATTRQAITEKVTRAWRAMMITKRVMML